MLPKTSFAIQVIRSRYEGMISMFCSQCGAPMGDNDKFCGVCGAPNTEVKAAGPAPQAQPQPQGQPFAQPQPQPFVAPQPAMNVPKGCMAQAFNDMIKVPGALVRVCQIAFLPALICVVSVLVLFIPVIGGIAAAIGFLLAYVASVCGAGFAIEWGRDLSLKDDSGMERPLLRSTSFGLGIFSSVITNVLGFVAIIPVIGVVLSVLEGAVIGAVGSYYFYGSSGLEGALIGSMGLLVFALFVSFVLGIFFKMFGDAAVMHFAVAGRVESAFSLEKVKFTPLITSARASGYWKLTSRKVSSPRGALAAGSLGETGSLMLVGQVMTSSTRSAATSARGRITETMVRIINAMTICMV